MKKLTAAMVGEWTGSGMMMNQTGRHTTKSYEKVESRLNGLVLVVHGRHVDVADTTKVVHEAFGMLFFDEATKKLKFVPVNAQSQTVETWANETPKGLDWGLTVPGGAGQVKYVVDLSAPDTWVENGSFSRDGTNWMPLLELKLTRKK